MYNYAIGYDPREDEVYEVAAHSARRFSAGPINIVPIKLADLRARGLYTRPTSHKNGALIDDISNAPMSTEFAISRFFINYLAINAQWVLFTDCDFLFRCDIAELFDYADDKYAVLCVHHQHNPNETIKMDNQLQTKYNRKNWSSMMLWNTRHPAHQNLTIEMLNTLPGRDLHRFCWLQDEEIGQMPHIYNWLEGTHNPADNPKVIHYTRGGPWFADYQHVAFANEWRNEYNLWKHSQK